MAAAEYLREAMRALGIDPAAAPDAIEIGETTVGDNEPAVRAVIERRLTVIRDTLASPAARALPPAARAALEAADFLTFGEYLDTVPRVRSILERDQRIANAEARRQFDRFIDPTKPKHYAEYNAPTSLEIDLARNFDPNLHTEDFAGYLAYVKTKDNALSGFFLRKLSVLIPEKARELHTYIVGQSGSGKSSLIKALLYSYVRKPEPVGLVVIDPHGDMAEQIAKWPTVAESGRLVYVYPSPYFSPDHTPTLNPFELADHSEASVELMTQQLASVFEELMRGAGHASLTGQMKAILAPCIATLLRRPGSSLFDLQTFMNDERNAALHALGLKSPNPSDRQFFRHSFYTKDYDTTKNSISTRLQSLLQPSILRRLLVGKSTIDLEKEIDAGNIVIFNLPLGAIGEEISATFGKFVLASLQAIALRRQPVPEYLRRPCHVFVDECQYYLTTSVKRILTGGRKYGMHLTLAQQQYGQDMSQDLADAISNVGVRCCGVNDVPTLKRMSERIGTPLKSLQAQPSPHITR